MKMNKNKVIMLVIFLLIISFLLVPVLANDDNDNDDAEGYSKIFGQLGGIFFLFAFVTGIMLHLYGIRYFSRLFYKFKIKRRFVIKIHCLVAFLSVFFVILHLTSLGCTPRGDSAWTAFYLLIALCITGALFPYVRGKKRRYLRHFHLTLLILALIVIYNHHIY